MEKHFQESVWKSFDITDKPIEYIFNGQLDIRLGEKTWLSSKKGLKTEKLKPLMKYHQKYERQINLTSYFLNYTTLYKQNTIEKWMKGCMLLFLKKGDHRILLWLLRFIMPCFTILGKIRTVFSEINPQLFRFWLFVESSKDYVQWISRQHYCWSVSPRHLILYTKRWSK